MILNGFSGVQDKELALTATFLQNMFAPIVVSKIKLEEARRVVVFHYEADDQLIHVRHYRIHIRSSDVSKPIRKVLSSQLTASLNQRLLHELSKVDDVADYVIK